MGQSSHGQSRDPPLPFPDASQLNTFTLAGAGVTASFAFALVWLIKWTCGGQNSRPGKGRVTVFLVIVIIGVIISYAYMRRQWLQYVRQHTLAEISDFVSQAREFDSVAAGALTLVQEVELVSRGYRM